MPSATLEQQIETKLKEPTKHEIWSLRYKRGPVMSEIHFKFDATGDLKADSDRAMILATRYIRFLASRENVKFTTVGTPQPFARDLENEMLKD